jgi:hypothetical protein
MVETSQYAKQQYSWALATPAAGVAEASTHKPPLVGGQEDAERPDPRRGLERRGTVAEELPVSDGGCSGGSTSKHRGAYWDQSKGRLPATGALGSRWQRWKRTGARRKGRRNRGNCICRQRTSFFQRRRVCSIQRRHEWSVRRLHGMPVRQRRGMPVGRRWSGESRSTFLSFCWIGPLIGWNMYRIIFYHQLQNSLTLYIYIYALTCMHRIIRKVFLKWRKK